MDTYEYVSDHQRRLTRRAQSLAALYLDLHGLTERAAELLQANLTPRSLSKGAQLRSVSTGGEVHLILQGVIRETDFPTGDPRVRFWGPGTLTGDQFVVTDEARFVSVECVTGVLSLSCPLSRMRALTTAENSVMRFVAERIVRRQWAADHVYSNFREPPLERVCRLLLHLNQRDEHDGNAVVRGPSQAELAEALMLSRASVENALRQLRKEGVLRTSYRGYFFREASLRQIATLGTSDPAVL
ncbi:Crp/Fnr family transcriptional regulator [Streptomyces sedi]|nr:Crp/Fnr family transcriptional regulator [Streptomyces sedi]